MKTTIVMLVSLAVIVGGLFMSYVSTYNMAVSQEAQIKASYDDMKNVLGQYSLKVVEAAKVPDMYRDDVDKVMGDAMTGRYGKDGSKAVFQMLKEQNPMLDVSVYKQIQEIIESGRDKFENRQTKFIDVKRQYEQNLGYFWTGTIMRFAGFPKINLDDYKVIQSEHGKETFDTGVDQGIKLR